MRAVDVIARKRDGLALSTDEIEFFVQGFAKGTIPDYQAAAWLMAVVLRGMDHRETTALTLAMVHSGRQLDLSDIAPFVVDKHSTGGVGDKTTLVVAPLAAASGLKVGKMSGRGLGFTGGTLDKLESIPGYRCDLSVAEFRAQLAQVGLVVTGQSADLAPADGKLYTLRDVTATVPAMPLMASSIMSKKIAAGTNGIVLDVKVGDGAFMKTEQQAVELARLMVEIGAGLGRRTRAVISDMSQPLGLAVGNAVELREAIDTLHGRGPADLRLHCLTIVAEMLRVAGQDLDRPTTLRRLEGLLDGGEAWQMFCAWIAAQGGDLRFVQDPERLPRAALVRELGSPQGGFISAIRADEVGMASMLLGGGRARKEDGVDHAVGVVLRAKVGDYVKRDEPLLTVHANDEGRLTEATERLLAAYSWSDGPVSAPILMHQIIG